jgi:hypothetical protein
MTDATKFLNSGTLHDLKSVSHHFLNSARLEGKKTSTPLAFMGAITVAIGDKMLWDTFKQTDGGRESTIGR